MIEDWMRGVKLELTLQKTDVILVSNLRRIETMEVIVGRQVISSKRTLNYLGVMIDDQLNFNSHVDYACSKASKAHAAIARVM